MGVSSRGCCGIVAVAAVYSLIQSLIWLVLAVYTIMLEECKVQPDVTNPPYLLILVYFFNEECVPQYLLEHNVVESGYVPAKTQRTQGVVLYFLVSCALRAAASAALLCALVVVSGRGRGVSRTGVFFWVWALLSAGCLVGDLVCAILYGTDLSDTENLWTLLGISEPTEDLDKYLRNLWALPVAPIFMMLVCLRFVILWIPEAIMLPIAFVTFWKDRKEEKWLMNLSSSTPGGSTPPVTVPWMTAGSGDRGVGGAGVGGPRGSGPRGSGPRGSGADVVRHPSGVNRAGSSQQGAEYHEINTPSLEYLSVPADSQAWGGARPRDPNWRSGGGGGGGSNGGGPDRWNPEGGGGQERWSRDGGGGGGPPPRRHAPPPPLHLPPQQQPRDSTSSQQPPVQASPDRVGAWDPRSPLPGPGAQPSFFGGPPPSHTTFGHPPPHMHAPFRPSGQAGAAAQPRGMPVAVPTVPEGPQGYAQSPSPSPSPTPEAGAQPPLAQGDAGRRWVEQLKDHDAERRRRDAQKEAERKRRMEQLEEEERQERDRALQEVADRAEARRRRRAEAEVEAAARRAGPPVAPKPRIAELQNQRLWSYVLPPRDNLPERRHSPAARAGAPAAPDEDYDSDDDEKPPVPVPDYTLHFNRPSDRPALANTRD